jgi:hypothetical protein
MKMSFFTTRLFAVLALIASGLSFALAGPETGCLVFLACTMISLSPQFGHSLGTTAANGGFAVGSSQDQSAIGMLVNQIGSANWSQWQIIRYTFYDYARFANTGALTTSINLFSVPLGGADPVSGLTKTTEQTNMVQAAQFGQQYFVIQQIRTHLFPQPKVRQNAAVAATTTFTYDQAILAAQIRTVLSTGILSMVIGQKAYFDISQPMRTAPPGFGLSQVIAPFDYTTAVAANANAPINAFVAQSNTMDDVYNLTPPQLIEPAQTFQMTLSFPDLGYNWQNTLDAAAQNANVDIGVILDGYLARPMQ